MSSPAWTSSLVALLCSCACLFSSCDCTISRSHSTFSTYCFSRRFWRRAQHITTSSTIVTSRSVFWCSSRNVSLRVLKAFSTTTWPRLRHWLKSAFARGYPLAYWWRTISHERKGKLESPSRYGEKPWKDKPFFQSVLCWPRWKRVDLRSCLELLLDLGIPT